MDDFAAEMLSGAGAAADLQSIEEDQSDSDSQVQSSRTSGLKSRVDKLRSKASLQDRLMEKLLQQVIPAGDGSADPSLADPEPFPHDKLSRRPNFNITTMSNNFRRFNARIGVVFKFQARVLRLLAWSRYSHTLSFLAVYTFVCLDPYLLCVLPAAALLFGVLVPNFLTRHPAPPGGADSAAALSAPPHSDLSIRGPPLAPARTVKPVKELSRDFFRNMRDLQNGMDDFTRAHDQVVALTVPLTNFSDEALSSAVFLGLAVAGVTMSIAAHLLPWRLVFLAVGWAVTCSGHPRVARLVESIKEQHVAPQERRARSAFSAWVAGDVILDGDPETREVEVFELQRKAPDTGDEWEAWLFSPSPYDPLSRDRLAGERPKGTRFFEDVVAPPGWEWSEKKWALDLWSREWVEERIITGVEVETEGERWVYDIFNEEADRERGMVVEQPQPGSDEVDDAASERDGLKAKDKAKAAGGPPVTWEETLEGVGRRGEWRRRRWVRLVKRKNITG